MSVASSSRQSTITRVWGRAASVSSEPVNNRALFILRYGWTSKLDVILNSITRLDNSRSDYVSLCLLAHINIVLNAETKHTHCFSLKPYYEARISYTNNLIRNKLFQ